MCPVHRTSHENMFTATISSIWCQPGSVVSTPIIGADGFACYPHAGARDAEACRNTVGRYAVFTSIAPTHTKYLDMVRWIYSEPESTDSVTGETRSPPNRARPTKTARGPPKVRQNTPQSSRCMPRAIGRDLASIEVLKLFLRHFQNDRPKISGSWKSETG